MGGSALAAVVGAAQIAAVASNHGYKSSKPWLPRGHVGPALPVELLVKNVSLPKNFDWRDVNGINYATSDWNQHIPQYCGGCWIHGTTSALNDRIKVMRQAEFPDIMLSRQAILNCVPDPSGDGPPPGCNGGDSIMIHKYLHENKVPDETCLHYQARNMGCSAENVCRNCIPGSIGCYPVKSYIGYGVSSFGQISGEEAMMKEIYARGPIACSFATDDVFMFNFSSNSLQHEGVFVTNKTFNESQIDHVMEVAGWGETPSGLKYWVIRNSWGTYWGEAGWLKFRRGDNQMLSESECDWAVPTFDDLNEVLLGEVLGDYVRGISHVPPSEKAVAADEKEVPARKPPSLALELPIAPQLAARGSSEAFAPASLAGVALTAFLGGVLATLVASRLPAAARKAPRQSPLLG